MQLRFTTTKKEKEKKKEERSKVIGLHATEVQKSYQ